MIWQLTYFIIIQTEYLDIKIFTWKSGKIFPLLGVITIMIKNVCGCLFHHLFGKLFHTSSSKVLLHRRMIGPPFIYLWDIALFADLQKFSAVAIKGHKESTNHFMIHYIILTRYFLLHRTLACNIILKYLVDWF